MGEQWKRVKRLSSSSSILKSMVFLVVMYGFESWTIKKAGVLVTQSCLTLCDPMDCSPPGSAHGILQERILELVAILAERWRIDAFKLWSWRRLLRVPWTARSKQSILSVISPEYSFKRLLLQLQYIGYLMQRANSLGKILMVGKIEGKRRRQQRMRWLMVSSTQ